MNWWLPENYARKLPYLKSRMAMIQGVRRFFDGLGFLEVETPALQVSPGLEPHLHAFSTEVINPERDKSKPRYLHTSPEFTMKKLLVAGVPDIYQICKVYRNCEGSRLHSTEFTMIEWYRTGATYEDIMNDCVNLFRAVCPDVFLHKGFKSDPHQEWQKISVREAFIQYCNIDIDPILDDADAFRGEAKKLGIRTAEDDAWDDVFFKIFLEKIEPNLGTPVPTILYDYPVSMAALSRPKKSDPRYAERFEIYVCGMELANAFGELTDAKVQKERFEKDMDLKQKLYGFRYPVDEDFIKALEHGMPECSGIALGIDRLAMLVAGVDTIDQVLWAEVL